MITCLADVLRPNVGKATVALLEHFGATVHFPETQTCCGQPFFNSGVEKQTQQLARHTIEVFADGRPVVTPSGSCAAMIRAEYPHVFPSSSPWHARAMELAGRTFELAEFLVHQLGVTKLDAQYDGTITYHPACHLRALQADNAVEQLLDQIKGTHCIPLRKSDQCCGFGGSFSVRYPEISGAMVIDKVSCIDETQADAVISSDTGCLMNIEGCLHRNNSKTQTMHFAELLATGLNLI